MLESIKGYRLSYKSFKTRDSHEFAFSLYCLKEFRNRWFVFGRRPDEPIVLTIALDRIVYISPATGSDSFIVADDFDPQTWFDNVVGVTKAATDKSYTIRFWAAPEQVPYIGFSIMRLSAISCLSARASKSYGRKAVLTKSATFGIRIRLRIRIMHRL